MIKPFNYSKNACRSIPIISNLTIRSAILISLRRIGNLLVKTSINQCKSQDINMPIMAWAMSSRQHDNMLPLYQTIKSRFK